MVEAARRRLVQKGTRVDEELLVLAHKPRCLVGTADLRGAPCEGVALVLERAKGILGRLEGRGQLALGRIRWLLDVQVKGLKALANVVCDLAGLKAELASAEVLFEIGLAGGASGLSLKVRAVVGRGHGTDVVVRGEKSRGHGREVGVASDGCGPCGRWRG